MSPAVARCGRNDRPIDDDVTRSRAEHWRRWVKRSNWEIRWLPNWLAVHDCKPPEKNCIMSRRGSVKQLTLFDFYLTAVRELNRTAKQHQQQPNSEYVIANKWNFISSVQISYWNDDICDGNTDEISSTSVSLSDTEISQKENAFSAQLMSSYMS